MFPSANSIVYRNEAGEPLGWDEGTQYDGEYDYDDYYNLDDEWDDRFE